MTGIMWRLQGLVGRVFNRCHGNPHLRLSQNHQDEVINSSTVLSTSQHSFDSSSQKGEDGERRKKQRTSQYCYSRLPRYTALDAVGWGAAAVLFMQICRRIHSQFSSAGEPSSSQSPGHLATSSVLQKCGYRTLLEILSRRDVLPRGRTVVCLQGVPEQQTQAQSHDVNNSSSSSSNSNSDSGHQHSSETDNLTADSSFSNHQGSDPSQDSPLPEETLISASRPPDPKHADTDCRQTTGDDNKDIMSDEDRLTAAALNLRHVADSSVPVILNIIGLESVQRDNYKAAFTCFLAAAECGYSKAQFNTGVCYERGRGVGKDKDKALYYYSQAAIAGHRQAQYRYAKLLFTSRGRKNTEELDTAIKLLEQAAAAGLTEAQVYLGSVFTQEPVRDEHKSIHYLRMAAESGDGTALLFLGQCYESGFGVQQNQKTAIEFYERAAKAGNIKAKSLLILRIGAEDAVLRSIRSSPCFSVSDHLCQSLSTLGHPSSTPSSHSVTLPVIPHSWSTGNLASPPRLSSMPFHPQAINPVGGTCRWTLGIG
ncbi:death ligand signal enhancer [Lampris incognitus]|uniref:death ligand signal enhancer n=1 Tax=Lampris incognitus TaxID=2546036 RepID=UPI0024B5AE14|nr:death ligand signal enhancer [Lampris incognitus]